MTLSDLCKGIYPACPGIKSQPDFIVSLFQAAGCPFFGSESYRKQLFTGKKPLTESLKAAMPTPTIESLTAFLIEKMDDARVVNVIASFGIPETGMINKQALAEALAIQFRTIVESAPDCGENVLIVEYQNRKMKRNTDPFSLSIKPLYPGDQFYIKTVCRSSYKINIYDRIQHTWFFDNVGTQVWTGRRLYFSNHDAVRPRASSNYIIIPDTPPQQGVKVSVEMDARGFEGDFECEWIMIDSDGKPCFPNCHAFSFTISSTLIIE